MLTDHASQLYQTEPDGSKQLSFSPPVDFLTGLTGGTVTAHECNIQLVVQMQRSNLWSEGIGRKVLKIISLPPLMRGVVLVSASYA